MPGGQLPPSCRFYRLHILQKKRELEDMARAAEAARDEEDSASPAAPVVEELVGDDFTRRAFGAEAVVVTTRFGLDDDGDAAAAVGGLVADSQEAALAELAAHAPPRRPRSGAGASASAAGAAARRRSGSASGRGRGRGGGSRGGSRGRARGGGFASAHGKRSR